MYSLLDLLAPRIYVVSDSQYRDVRLERLKERKAEAEKVLASLDEQIKELTPT